MATNYIQMQITEFIGHFHPLLVHLPIGILLIAILFQLLSGNERFHSMSAAAGIALFWGMCSAIASCITGFLLSKTDDYDETLIDRHQLFGISVAVVSVVAYFLNRKSNRNIKWVVILLALLIIITGHLGGSIVYGSDYLTKAFYSSGGNSKEIKRKPIPDVQAAVAYIDLIKPIFESRCYGCHGPNKQKGKLRLDEPDFILKGGKDGKVIVAGKADASELIERIFLAKDNEDHMPPKQKPQLSKQDLDLLHWWVSSGADFNKRVSELTQTPKIKPVLLALQSGVEDVMQLSDIPVTMVEKANEAAIQKLKDRGVTVTPVALNSNYLTANYVTVDSVTENDLKLLEPLRKQLIWLKLGGKKITDANLTTISKLSSLTRLYLDRTNVTDVGLNQVKNLLQLQYINLVGTGITVKGLEHLKEIKSLHQIFINQTGIKSNEWISLKKIFPGAQIDTGGYMVPILASDTTELKEAVKRN